MRCGSLFPSHHIPTGARPPACGDLSLGMLPSRVAEQALSRWHVWEQRHPSKVEMYLLSFGLVIPCTVSFAR